MNVFDLKRVAYESEAGVIAYVRRTAAIVAIAIPVIATAIVLAAFVKHGLRVSSLLMHTGMSLFLIPGSISAYIWIKRYYYPAISALQISGPAIYVDGETVFFLSKPFRIQDGMSFQLNGTDLELREREELVVKAKTFFLRSDLLGINRFDRLP